MASPRFVADRLAGTPRRSDIASRVGGEAFVGRDLHGGVHVGEAVRDDAGRFAPPLSGVPLHILSWASR